MPYHDRLFSLKTYGILVNIQETYLGQLSSFYLAHMGTSFYFSRLWWCQWKLPKTYIQWFHTEICVVCQMVKSWFESRWTRGYKILDQLLKWSHVSIPPLTSYVTMRSHFNSYWYSSPSVKLPNGVSIRKG